MKKSWLIVFSWIMTLCVFSGCEKIKNSEITDPIDLSTEKISALLPIETTEDFEIVDAKISEDNEKTTAYTFKTAERGLLVTAEYFDDPLVSEASNDYASVISNLYFDRVKEAIFTYENSVLDQVMYEFTRKRNSPSYIGENFVGDYLYRSDLECPCMIMLISNNDNVLKAANALAKAAAVYEQELKYHESDYLEQNPVAAVRIIYCDDIEALNEIEDKASSGDLFWKEECESLKDGRARVLGSIGIGSYTDSSYYVQRIQSLFRPKEHLDEIT